MELCSRRLPAHLLALSCLIVPLAAADSPDQIRITNQSAWNCSRVIGIRPFPVTGKFKGQQPQQAYMRLLIGELTSALAGAPGVTAVVEITPQMTQTPDLVLEGEFLELNTGSRAARFWVGMGAGKSKCAVQARGLTNPGRASVFELRHERISAMGLDSDELAENVAEVGRDIGRALSQSRQACTTETAATTTPVAAQAALSAAAPAGVDRGVFVIESTPPGAEVYVDGEFVGSTPIAEHGLATGRHEIELRKKGWAAWKRLINVSAGSRARVAAEMEPESPAPQPHPAQ